MSTFAAPKAATDPATSASVELGWRIASLLGGYRLLVGVTLLIAFAALKSPRAVGAHVEDLFQIVVLVYCALGIAGLIAARRRRPSQELQIRAALLGDLFMVPLLLHASGGVPSGLGNLIIVSVGASGLILPRRTAMMYAALAAIAILAEQTASFLEGLTQAEHFMNAGVIGGVTLLIAIVGQPVSQRLRESEALARQRGVDLANLSELNNYIIQHLRESILVLDADDTIRLINGTAARHLGHDVNVVGRHISSVYAPLGERAQSWRNDADETRSSLGNIMSADGTTMLTPHFAPIGDARPAPTLIFLEDATALAERVQQSKLAALGRLSASIAHEIRNPVGAISHAGQLLGESERLGDEEQRLAQIIHDHCGRVNNIVKNVLQLSRRDHAEPQLVQLDEWLGQFMQEFTASIEQAPPVVELRLDATGIAVRMDPTHLHQVLWNLCTNAVRYALAADGTGSLEIRAGRLSGTARPFVEVLDRGPGIDERFRENVFEPFFTRAKDGTGLGLFLARELCEVNRATLVYEEREGGGSCFRIIFADPQRWSY
jgi:two-component system sensor histidine kinase PilS (NtrC family)